MVSKMKKSKKDKACKTCYGYGFWPDGTAPMGPIDAKDGMPTIACPECKANANPRTNIWVDKEMSERELQNRISKLKKIHKLFLRQNNL